MSITTRRRCCSFLLEEDNIVDKANWVVVNFHSFELPVLQGSINVAFLGSQQTTK
jgi:hypothetical protein